MDLVYRAGQLAVLREHTVSECLSLQCSTYLYRRELWNHVPMKGTGAIQTDAKLQPTPLPTVIQLRDINLTSFLLMFIVVAASAQSPPDSTYYHSDSSGLTNLGVVTVTARRSKVKDITIDNVVPRSEIQNTDGTDVASVMYEIPAARVQTNSRGESNLYLRNAGERQVAIFFDGALLNIPWDNRVDLSLLPANAVGGFLVSKGAPSVLYGANTIGGAVNIVTRELEEPGSMTILELSGGTGNQLSAAGAQLYRKGPLSLVGTFSFSQRDGVTVPRGALLPYSQPPGDLRENTDARTLGLFLRGGFEVNKTDRIGLSVNMVDGAKGIAPEGHLNPAEEGVRYWRYPAWQWVNVIASYAFYTGEHDHYSLTGSTWTTLFTQQIDQYQDSTYAQRTDQQKDNDLVLGSRTVLANEGESSIVSLSLNNLYSRHRQTDSEISTDDVISSTPEQSYAQYTGSIGAEYRVVLSNALDVGVGSSLDVMATLDSDDKPKQEAYLQPGATLSATLKSSENTSIGLSLGRKSRFPSMRELYGVALNRFLINPDLQPESAFSAELVVERNFDRGDLQITGFAQLVDNTIDQRNVEINGIRLRQRYNLDGSRIFGVEVNGGVRPFDWLDVHGHLTWTHARSNQMVTGGEFFLSEKPEVIGTLNLRVRGPKNTRIDAEARGVGRAFSVGPEDQFVELPAGVTINLRASWLGVELGPTRLLEIYVRANNLFDGLLYNQLGLPESGRAISVGAKTTL